MIEVEKKVLINETQLKAIEEQALFLETHTINDSYYDTFDYRFTRSDIWLRERNCKFELKIGIKGVNELIDRYLEITSEAEILKKLGLENEPHLSKALKKAGIIPYVSYQTIRRKYRIGSCILDLDLAYFDDYIYRVLEIELMVAEEAQIPQAEAQIFELMDHLNLESKTPVKAKLIAYLSEKSPTHYQTLIDAGVVKEPALSCT